MTLTPSIAEIATTPKNFEHGINRIAISTDGFRVAISDIEMNVSVYHEADLIYTANFGSISEKIKPTERIRGLAFSPKADILYVAAGEAVQAIRIANLEIEWTYVAPRSFGFLIISPICLDVSEDGDVVAAFDNGSIGVWDAHGVMKALWHDNDSPRTVRFVPGGEEIVGTDSFSLCVWDIKKRKRRFKLSIDGRVYGMDVHPSGDFAAARRLQDVVVWDLVARAKICEIPVAPGIPIMAMHPYERWVACGERNRIKVTDFDGTVVQTHILPVASALCFAFTHSGSELLVGCTKHELIRIPMTIIDEPWRPV